MSESSKFKDMLKQNRKIFLAILMLPIFGMIVSIPLIIWVAPNNLPVILGVIILLIIQYLILVYWISKKMDEMTHAHALR